MSQSATAKSPSVKTVRYEQKLSQAEYMELLYATQRKKAYFFVCENLANKPYKLTRVGKNFVQKSFNVKDISKSIEYMAQEGLDDFYITNNLFDSRSRTIESAAQITSLPFDLDPYKSKLTKTEFREMDIEEIVEHLEDNVFGVNIPFPNIVVFSGYGIYLIYLLQYTPVNDGVKLKRKVVNKIMYELLKDYGVDAKSMDVPHVFRPPDTYNIKGIAEGDIRKVRAVKNWLPRYTLGEIADALPSLWTVFKQANKIGKKSQKRSSKKTTGKAKIVSLDRDRQYSYDMIQTVYQLGAVRGWNCEGYREMMCFFVANYYMAMNRDRFEEQDPELCKEALEQVKKINQKFTVPLREEELEDAITKHTIYKFKIETFYDWFGIDSLEEKALLKVKSREAKNYKNKMEKRIATGVKVGHDQVRQEIRNTLLDNSGLPNTRVVEIVKEKLGKCSRNTVIAVRDELRKSGEIE